MTEVLADQAAGLRQLLRGGRPRSITVASASPHMGCSAVAANLAVSLSSPTDDLVYVPDQPFFDFSNGVTVAGWFNPTSTTQTLNPPRSSRTTHSRDPES